MSSDAFVKSIEPVMTREAVFPPAFQTSAHDTRSEYRSNAVGEDEGANLVMSDDASAPQLSPRELAILRCLISGNSNKCLERKIDRRGNREGPRQDPPAEDTGARFAGSGAQISRDHEHGFQSIVSTQVADDALGLVLPLDGRRHDLVEGGFHAVKLEFAHEVEDLSSFHQMVLRRLS
jgi:hypothetical protein